jgi:alkylation response protein AidB-like acyl-CoA dehydrogenase
MLNQENPVNKNIDPFERIIGNFPNVIAAIPLDGKNAEEEETVSLLTQAISRFGKQHVDSARIDRDSHIPTEVIHAAAEMGLFGLTIDPRYGGSGLSMKAASRVIQEIAVVDCSIGVSIGLHNGLGLRGLNLLGSDTLKQKYLPDLAQGKRIACFAATESDAGSDIASLRTTAIQDGDELIINGSKAYVTNGGFASVATIAARTPGLNGSPRGHSLILIPLDHPGVHRDAEEGKLGIRGSSTLSLHFDNVRVGKDHILGRPSFGLDHLNQVLTWGRTFLASGCIGVARMALEKALDHVTTRVQFKRPIVEFGMVREKVAGLRGRLHMMESLSRLVTRLEDEQAGSIAWESLVTKIACSESAWESADDALQLHGGSGFIEEVGVARFLRDIRITRIFEGANEVLRFHLASAAFTWDIDAMMRGKPLQPLLDKTLSQEGAVFDSLRRRIAEALLEEKKKHGLKVFQRQMVQHRVADTLISLYILLAVLARAQGELLHKKPTDNLLSWTRYIVVEMTRQIEYKLQGMHSNADDLCHRIAAAECARIDRPLRETIA